MGLSLYYSGCFNPQSSLQEMIEEIKDIAEANKWPYRIFETEFPLNSIGKKNTTGIFMVSSSRHLNVKLLTCASCQTGE